MGQNAEAVMKSVNHPRFRFQPLWIIILVLLTWASTVQAEDQKQLLEIQTKCVEYFAQTPHGKCDWVWTLLGPDPADGPRHVGKYSVAFNQDQVFWVEEPTLEYSQSTIVNSTQRIEWLRIGADGGSIGTKPLTCFQGGNPMMGRVLHPRYVGTCLLGLVGGVIEKAPAPRGVFSDGTLSAIGLEEDEIDGTAVWKGLYKWGVWDLSLYYTKTSPTLLKRSLLSARSQNGIRSHRVDLEYKHWESQVFYPSRMEYHLGLKKDDGSEEDLLMSTLDVSGFRPLTTTERKSQFQLGALNPPEGVAVHKQRRDCSSSDHFKWRSGDLVPFTDDQEEAWEKEKQSLKEAKSPWSATSEQKSVEPSFRWWLGLLIAGMVLACGFVAKQIIKGQG